MLLQRCGDDFAEQLAFERVHPNVRITQRIGIDHLADNDAEESRIARAPRGRESVPAQLHRLVDAHEFILQEARPLAREAADRGDDGTDDLIVSQVVRTNELQSWFIQEHLVAST